MIKQVELQTVYGIGQRAICFNPQIGYRIQQVAGKIKGKKLGLKAAEKLGPSIEI